ncbi:MAG: type II toxin-antitoxin system YafQ family toxin [bacterium]
MKLNWSTSYKRSYIKIIIKNPALGSKIISTMSKIEIDPLMPELKTHKLKGVLDGSWACAVDYDIRIIFDFVRNKTSGESEILLLDIGTHEQVY